MCDLIIGLKHNLHDSAFNTLVLQHYMSFMQHKKHKKCPVQKLDAKKYVFQTCPSISILGIVFFGIWCRSFRSCLESENISVLKSPKDWRLGFKVKVLGLV